MARKSDSSTDAAVRGSAGRFLRLVLLLAILVGVGAAAAVLGYYEIQPGQHAVVLRLGHHVRTETNAGFHFRIPFPIETVEVVPVGQVSPEEFGQKLDEGGPSVASEAGMQTSDNNIVRVNFAVQYRIKDAFRATYQIADLRDTVRDAAQAAMREVVGRHSIDGVISEEQVFVSAEARDTLQAILDNYKSGVEVMEVQLEDAQAPAPVRDAFDDVIGAAQDRDRRINEAEGYANEVVPEARGQASELRESARGYKESKIAQATGEAERFLALVTEYRKAPDVTRTRIYLEVMEEVLPDVEKVLIEPGSNLVPYLPVGPRKGAAQATGARP